MMHVCCMGNIQTVSCRLVNVDIYSFDFKLNHIAKHLKLPAAPRLGPAALDMPPEERLPPVLVVNVQLPNYPVSTVLDQRLGCSCVTAGPAAYHCVMRLHPMACHSHA